MKKNLSQELQDRIFKRRLKTGIINIGIIFIMLGAVTFASCTIAQGIVEEMDRQDCESFQFQKDNSISFDISELQATRCELLGFDLK